MPATIFALPGAGVVKCTVTDCLADGQLDVVVDDSGTGQTGPEVTNQESGVAILVTGGSGFILSRVTIRHWVERSADCRVISAWYLRESGIPCRIR